MGDRRRLNLSIDLVRPDQRRAWDILSAIPLGQRTQAVCRMVAGYLDQRELLEAVRAAIREAIREELDGVSSTKTNTQREKAGDVDDTVLGFLRALQEGDEIT